MKIKIDGHNGIEIEVLQHAVAKTDVGVAGYVECIVGGKNIRVVGRYDNPYSPATTEKHGSEIGEQIWIDDTWTEPQEGEEPYMFDLDPGSEYSDGITAETIMSAIVEAIEVVTDVPV